MKYFPTALGVTGVTSIQVRTSSESSSHFSSKRYFLTYSSCHYFEAQCLITIFTKRHNLQIINVRITLRDLSGKISVKEFYFLLILRFREIQKTFFPHMPHALIFSISSISSFVSSKEELLIRLLMLSSLISS